MQSSQKRAAVGPVPIVPWNRFRALCLGIQNLGGYPCGHVWRCYSKRRIPWSSFVLFNGLQLQGEKTWRILDVLISSFFFGSNSSLTVCDSIAFFLHTVLSVTIMTNNISIDYDELYIYVYRYFYPYTSIFRCFISIQCLSSAFPAWLWRFRTLLFLWGWSSYPTGSWGHPHRRGLRLLRRFDDFANLAKKLSKRLKETLKA